MTDDDKSKKFDEMYTWLSEMHEFIDSLKAIQEEKKEKPEKKGFLDGLFD